MEPTDLSSELALAKKAAEASGKLLQNKKKQFNEILSSNSKDIKLKADTESEELIKEIITSQSAYPILSEESGKSSEKLGDIPSLDDLIGSIKVLLDKFEQGEIDKVYLASNRFENTMTQQPEIKQLLPLLPEDTPELKHRWDYIYEPDAKELLDGLMQRYIESLVYQAVIENIACEQAAKMVAMKNATENAGTIIDELQLIYNNARQAAITQELSEIVAGAEAI